MKIFLAFIFTLSVLEMGVAPQLHADSSSAIDTLKTQVQKACETHDLNAIKQCYDFDGVPAALGDIEMNVWQEYFKLNDKTSHYLFEKVDYMSLDQAMADKTNNPKAILAMTEPRTMNGTVYQPNLKVVGFLTPWFKQGSNTAGTVQPVGLAADGTAKLTSSRPIK